MNKITRKSFLKVLAATMVGGAAASALTGAAAPVFIQLAFLKQLLERKLITDREYSLIKQRLMKDYRVVSELSS